jgi:hypothetical protein
MSVGMEEVVASIAEFEARGIEVASYPGRDRRPHR